MRMHCMSLRHTVMLLKYITYALDHNLLITCGKHLNFHFQTLMGQETLLYVAASFSLRLDVSQGRRQTFHSFPLLSLWLLSWLVSPESLESAGEGGSRHTLSDCRLPLTKSAKG